MDDFIMNDSYDAWSEEYEQLIQEKCWLEKFEPSVEDIPAEDANEYDDDLPF